MTTLKTGGNQGDISFHPVKNITSDAIDITATLYDKVRGGYTIALGEVTNHAHTFITSEDDAIRIFEKNNDRYIHIKKPCRLLHGTFTSPAKVNEKEKDKHGYIDFIPGIWKVGREVGYNPWEQRRQAVVD